MQVLKHSSSILTGLFLLLISMSAHAIDWAECGREHHGDCKIPNKGNVTMRYGDLASHDFFYYNFEGESSAPCSNFNGDPKQGTDKMCYYTHDDTGLGGGAWGSACAKEGKECQIGSQPTWVRYGKDSRWFAAIRSGKFKCSNDSFGTDPYKGKTKECQVGESVFGDVEPEWIDCAVEGRRCVVNDSGRMNGVIIRYGLNDRWTYRSASLDSIDCSNKMFGTDPYKGKGKLCQYTVMLNSAVTVGAWAEVGSCLGLGCDISRTVAYGTEHTDTTLSSQEWSKTVTVSMESGFEIEGVGSKVSTSVASSYAESRGFQRALSTSLTESTTVNCGEKGVGVEKRLYQFVTNTTKACLEDGGCFGSTNTLDMVCAIDPPLNYSGPQCAPNDCDGEFCSRCLSQSR